VQTLNPALSKGEGVVPETNEKYLNKFRSQLENDLNTAQALATVWTLLKDKEVSDNELKDNGVKDNEVSDKEVKGGKRKKIIKIIKPRKTRNNKKINNKKIKTKKV
jgi:cysteinyl-tRNA synthetase